MAFSFTPIKINFSALSLSILPPFGEKNISGCAIWSLRFKKKKKIQDKMVHFGLIFTSAAEAVYHSTSDQPQLCCRAHLQPTIWAPVNKHFLYLRTTLLQSYLAMRSFYK